MFSEEAKKFIELEVANEGGRVDETLQVDDVARKIQSLELALEISEHIPRLKGLKSSIHDQIEYMAINKKIDSMEEFEKTAQYLELFIYLVNPGKFETIQGKKTGNGPRNNSEAIPDYLYELQMISEEKEVGFIRCTYKNPASYSTYSDMFKVYGNLYYVRNEEAHSVRLLSPTQAWQYVRELLIIYLEVAGKYQYLLESESNRLKLTNETRAEEYLKDLIADYEQEQSKKSLKYIALDGRESKTSSKDSLVDIINKKNDCKIKIIGNAGMGKTTTLKYLAYMDAKKQKGRTPVILELKDTSEVENTIIGMVGNKKHLDCSEEMVKKLLENGFLNLYVDGINEIYNVDLKKSIVTQINNIITEYPKTKVVLTDRESNKVTVTDNVLIYVVEQLDDAKMKKFIEDNTNNKEELKTQVLKLVEENEALKNMVRIPFRLYKLITIVKEGKEIPKTPQEFDVHFRNAIIEREVEEKGSKDADNLILFINAIVSLGQKEYSRIDLINVISLTIKDCSLTNVASDEIITLLLDLHIMEKVSFQTYRFENQELQKTIEDQKEEPEETEVNLEGLI